MNRKTENFIDAEREGSVSDLHIKGDWTIYNAASIKKALLKRKHKPKLLDMKDVGKLDTAGAWLITKHLSKDTALRNVSPQQSAMLEFMPPVPEPPKKSWSLPQLVINDLAVIGQAVCQSGLYLYRFMAFTGVSAVGLAGNFIRPRRFRLTSIVRHIHETGIKALPIVSLLSFGTSMVVAYQGATQLQKFGADLYTIDLTVVSLLREMSVLITAIIVAGRSGSAFAAEIGVMKLRGEVDALRVMGMNPVELLVLPRFIALLITLPLLTFVATIVGLAGGWVMAYDQLGIGLDAYVSRVQSVITPEMFFVGMIKAPVFAFLTALICTYQGMHVSGSAENVGKVTTLAVVQSIFTIIMADAIFSIVFAKAGL